MTKALAHTIESIVGERPLRIQPLSGGCVGDVFAVAMPSGLDLVAKVGDGPDSGLAREGRMLAYLAEHSELPVPEVISASDTLLLMTKIETGGGLNADAERHAGELVARLHDITTDKGFGFDEDTVIGGLHQPNPWTASWRDFFAEQRLVYMGREAERAGRLPARVMARVEKFAADIARWIIEPAQPSLIHGDMWGGNVLARGGRVTGFIDPAIYFADAEIELAFTQLFSTFGDAFFASYRRHRAIAPGFFEQRVDIYNLYPLLVHVRLFGGGYVQSVERTLARFGY